MRAAQRILCAAALLTAALLPEPLLCARANDSPLARAAHPTVECVGYFTLEAPDQFEYALPNQFPDGLSSWGTAIRLDLSKLGTVDLLISQLASQADLKMLMDSENVEQGRIKQELLRKADLFQAPDLTRDDLLNEAKAVPTFRPIRDTAIGASFGAEKFSLHALVNGHILSTDVKPQGTPEQTLDALLSHYRPRAPGEVPTGPGVCVPYGFFSGETQPATIGLNLRLKDRPDIVIFLLATDAASDPPDDPRKLWDGLGPAATFFGSKRVTPLHPIKPLRSITIDGHEGLGSFVRVTRRTVADQRTAFNNAAENDEDWGYFAYVPGVAGRKPGESFNLKFKVERFGRFAKRPMKEDEFRELVLRIAASIKRRPGAWVPN